MNEAREASEKETRERALQQGARAVSEAMVPTTRADARKGAGGDAAAAAMEDDETSGDERGVEAGSTRRGEKRAEPSTAGGEESEASRASESETDEDEGARGGDAKGNEAKQIGGRRAKGKQREMKIKGRGKRRDEKKSMMN